ncbi:hypothetical protein BAUCODRAFT_130481 [Baudoinia panamericana UAMH 10762]|uniref:Uncharacterized protein n=1 Tax=Baudoinia panamericana (strain UAMH 10762) TaxID=717646 RepID=M2NDJ6_BAUPA|nr:uncharacterized protein BAUCODRAFT_130481 [Baudoinia panamericana UAMH 10762]EMC97294.1 hypothetical protein BAUCODRAFT_130481 [Baudoinia panamericana UAMH 10762]
MPPSLENYSGHDLVAIHTTTPLMVWPEARPPLSANSLDYLDAPWSLQFDPVTQKLMHIISSSLRAHITEHCRDVPTYYATVAKVAANGWSENKHLRGTAFSDAGTLYARTLIGVGGASVQLPRQAQSVIIRVASAMPETSPPESGNALTRIVELLERVRTNLDTGAGFAAALAAVVADWSQNSAACRILVEFVEQRGIIVPDTAQWAIVVETARVSKTARPGENEKQRDRYETLALVTLHWSKEIVERYDIDKLGDKTYRDMASIARRFPDFTLAVQRLNCAMLDRHIDHFRNFRNRTQPIGKHDKRSKVQTHLNPVEPRDIQMVARWIRDGQIEVQGRAVPDDGIGDIPATMQEMIQNFIDLTDEARDILFPEKGNKTCKHAGEGLRFNNDGLLVSDPEKHPKKRRAVEELPRRRTSKQTAYSSVSDNSASVDFGRASAYSSNTEDETQHQLSSQYALSTRASLGIESPLGQRTLPPSSSQDQGDHLSLLQHDGMHGVGMRQVEERGLEQDSRRQTDPPSRINGTAGDSTPSGNDTQTSDASSDLFVAQHTEIEAEQIEAALETSSPSASATFYNAAPNEEREETSPASDNGTEVSGRLSPSTVSSAHLTSDGPKNSDTSTPEPSLRASDDNNNLAVDTPGTPFFGSGSSRVEGEGSQDLTAIRCSPLLGCLSRESPSFVPPPFASPQFAPPPFTSPQFASPQFASPQFDLPPISGASLLDELWAPQPFDNASCLLCSGPCDVARGRPPNYLSLNNLHELHIELSRARQQNQESHRLVDWSQPLQWASVGENGDVLMHNQMASSSWMTLVTQPTVLQSSETLPKTRSRASYANESKQCVLIHHEGNAWWHSARGRHICLFMSSDSQLLATVIPDGAILILPTVSSSLVMLIGGNVIWGPLLESDNVD